MKSYLLQINDSGSITFESIGIESFRLNIVSNGVDTFSFFKKFRTISSTSPAVNYSDTVRLIYRNTDLTPTDKCVFIGTIENLPYQADPKKSGGSYLAKGPTHDLQRCDYSQSWSYRDAAGDIQDDFNPNVCLCDFYGTRLTTGQQISAVVIYSVGRGLDIALGTVAPGLFAPYDQKSNITCWDAVVAMLRYTPDHVVWWDYDNQVSGAYVPALNVTASADMPPASFAHNTLNQISLNPCHDLVIPGIQVIFEMTSTVDSQTYRSRSVQTAGDHTHPRRLSLLYPLDGFHSTTQKQPIEVELYPTLTTDAATKSWAHANVLWLRKLIYTDWNIESVTRSGALSLPNRLLKGTPVDWLEKKVDFEEEDITIKVEYTVKNAAGTAIKKETKDITLKVMSTEAETKTYTRQGSFQSAEEEPTNFASDLYSSWSILHYSGSIGLKQQVPAPSVRPGQTVNVTGGIAAWTTMAAIIQDTTINYPAGHITHNLGPCPRLEADTLMSIFRSVRARRFSTERMTRDDPDDTDDIWGPTSSPSSSISDGSPADKIEHLRIESIDGTKTISLQPTDLTGESAVEIKPREIKIITSNSATPAVLTQQTYQVMASDGTDAETVTLPAGAANMTVLTEVKQFRISSGYLEIVFGAKNSLTGGAVADITKQIALTDVTVVTEAGYASTAFSRTKRTLSVLGAGTDGSPADFVTLVSHASQHYS